MITFIYQSPNQCSSNAAVIYKLCFSFHLKNSYHTVNKVWFHLTLFHFIYIYIICSNAIENQPHFMRYAIAFVDFVVQNKRRERKKSRILFSYHLSFELNYPFWLWAARKKYVRVQKIIQLLESSTINGNNEKNIVFTALLTRC